MLLPSLHAIEPGHLICAARNLAPYKDCGDKFPPHLSLWWPMKSSQDSGPWFSNSHLHPLCSSKEERKKRGTSNCFKYKLCNEDTTKKRKIIFVVSSLHNLHLKQFDVSLFNEIKHLGIWKRSPFDHYHLALNLICPLESVGAPKGVAKKPCYKRHLFTKQEPYLHSKNSTLYSFN